jgi:rod shape-determining protein MreD
MIVTPKMAIRIGLLLIVTVVLQVSFFSYLSVLGAAPYVVPVVVVALGLLGGGVVGAACGFAAGLLLDSVLLQTLGVSSLVLLLVGYFAGRYREGIEITGSVVPALLSGAFTLLAAAGFSAIELMLGVDAPVSLLVVREILVQGLLGVVLGFGVYPLVRRIVRPALIDYTPAPAKRLLVGGRRRRARRGGGVSPASPANRTVIHGGVRS